MGSVHYDISLKNKNQIFFPSLLGVISVQIETSISQHTLFSTQQNSHLQLESSLFFWDNLIYRESNPQHKKGMKMKKPFFLRAAVLILAVVSGPAAGYGQNPNPLLSLGEYNQIARQHPNFAPVYFERGMAQFSAKKYAEAIQDLTEAIAMRPNDADAYYMRGAARLAGSQLNQAVADLDRAADLRQEMFAATYRMRGTLYLTRAYTASANPIADAQAALDSFDLLVRLDPDCAQARYERGRAYFAKADFAKTSFAPAIADFDKAISINPNFEAARKERKNALYQQQLFKGQSNLK